MANRRRALALGVLCFAVIPSAIVGQRGRPPASSMAAAPFDVTEQSIEALRRALDAHQVTSRQLVDLYLARIAAYDADGPALNAIAAINPKAREAAEALDAERAA